MIKIVTIDLDGTLFNDQKVITEKNKEIIKKCHELGVRIVICTGRPTSGVLPVLEELGLTTINDYAIIYNGAKIINACTKEEIFSTTIDGKVVKELYLESKRLNTFIHAFRKNEELICNKYNPYTEIEARLNNLYAEVIDFDSISDDELFLKCMLIDNPDSEINNGGGFFISPTASPQKRAEIREYHEEHLLKGWPYFILDFLYEDLEKNVPIIMFGYGDNYYRKGIKPKYYSQEYYEKRLKEIEEANQKKGS